MATGNNLNPCQLVETQHRWLEGDTGVPHLREDGKLLYCRLQTRQLIKTDTGQVVPTQWVDVGVVTE